MTRSEAIWAYVTRFAVIGTAIAWGMAIGLHAVDRNHKWGGAMAGGFVVVALALARKRP